MERLSQQQAFDMKGQYGGNLLLFTLTVVIVIDHQRLVAVGRGH